MARVIVATCAHEGSLYSPDKCSDAPIRFYSDRWVEDDIAARFTGQVRRNRMSRKYARHVRKAASANRLAGLV
jgi:hypothetical protein